MLAADLVDAGRQQRDVETKLACKPGDQRVAGPCSAHLDADHGLGAHSRLLHNPARQRDRQAVAGHFGQEGLRDRMLWMGEDVGDMAALDDMAGIEHDDFLGELAHHGHLMGDQHDGHRELAVDVREQVEDRTRGLRI